MSRSMEYGVCANFNRCQRESAGNQKIDNPANYYYRYYYIIKIRV